MIYEIAVWKDAEKMTNVKPLAANKRLETLGSKNPDIFIDRAGVGESIIESVDIEFELAKLGKEEYNRTVRLVKLAIKGNLYLAAKSKGGADKAKKNSLKFSEWAVLQPDADKKEGYYRGITIAVLTKAGDFRVIQANNVYVESYRETYGMDEFGTFELHLAQRADATSSVKVKGVYEDIDNVKTKK